MVLKHNYRPKSILYPCRMYSAVKYLSQSYQPQHTPIQNHQSKTTSRQVFAKLKMKHTKFVDVSYINVGQAFTIDTLYMQSLLL